MKKSVLLGFVIFTSCMGSAHAHRCHGDHDDAYWANQYVYDGWCAPRPSVCESAWDSYEEGRRLANCDALAESVGPIRRAIELEPNIGEFHLTLALIYRDQGKRNEAVRELKLAEKWGHNAVLGRANTVLKEMGIETGGAGGANGNSLYQRLGGEGAITAVVDEFRSRVAADDKINKKFARLVADPSLMAVFRRHLIQQLCQATGGPQIYQGKDMKTAHEGLKITDGEFDALVGDLVGALNKFNVPNAEQKQLLDLLSPLRSDIVERPDL